MEKVYTDEIKQFIAENVKGTTLKQLTVLVNSKFGTSLTDAQIKGYKSRAKLKSETPGGVPAGRATIRYPQNVRDYIAANHKGVGPKKMAELLNRTFGTSYTLKQLGGFYNNNKISSGLTGCFPKGNVPFNKGRKGYCAPGSEKGHFKKGNIPVGQLPIGSEIRRGDGYVWVKVADPNRWRQKHRLLWASVNGKIPDGHLVTFLDGDLNNIALENLALVTRAEHHALTEFRLRSSDPEFTKTGIAIAKIKVAIRGRKRKKGKQNAETRI